MQYSIIISKKLLAYLEQLYTFGAVDRDPRIRVISVAYMALISRKRLSPRAGDDAGNFRKFFKARFLDEGLVRELEAVSKKDSKKTSKCFAYKRPWT